jgi:hypothetical protein
LGETENFTERIKDHDYKKTFWQKALVFISKYGAMTKADVQYMEHMAVALAQLTKKYNTAENKQIPKAPNLPAIVPSIKYYSIHRPSSGG